MYFLILVNCSRDSGLHKSEIPAVGTKGMVSTAHPIATEAGLKILKAGGNAFDAAVAIATTLNVVEPMMSGIGGNGTILVYDSGNDKIRYLDSSGKIPMKVNSDVFRAPTPNYLENRRGIKAISTPGNVNAWESMSKEYGKLIWADLFETAIETAENGFKINARLAKMIKEAYPSFPVYAQEFYGKNGRPFKKGNILIQKDLAKSMRLIAEKGSKVFYGGQLGRLIHNEMHREEGFLTIGDLIADKAEWWDPVKINYKGYIVYTASPPSTAFSSLIRLGMMSRFDFRDEEHNSTGYLHIFSEVTKHAFWCRLNYAGDPEISPPPLDTLLSEDYWIQEINKINREKASAFVYPGIITLEGGNTTHFVVADQWGNIVCATQTLGNAFGSRIMPAGTGIWLNNSLAYCTFEPKGNPMDAHPGQRKLSGDCPTIIFKNGKPYAALGTPGGHTIGQTVPQMVMNLIDFKMNIQAAISAPRVSFVEPDYLYIEHEIPGLVLAELKSMGHQIKRTKGLGNAHGLSLKYDDNGRFIQFEGGADPREEGLAEGF